MAEIVAEVVDEKTGIVYKLRDLEMGDIIDVTSVAGDDRGLALSEFIKRAVVEPKMDEEKFRKLPSAIALKLLKQVGEMTKFRE